MADLSRLNNQSYVDLSGDFFEKERQAAEELLQLQLKNVEKLAAARSNLTKKLNEEALAAGISLEDYLAQYGLKQRLAALEDEQKAISTIHAGTNKTYEQIRTKNAQALASAEKAIADARLKGITSAATAQNAALARQHATITNAEANLQSTRLESIRTEFETRSQMIVDLGELEEDTQQRIVQKTYQSRVEARLSELSDAESLQKAANAAWLLELERGISAQKNGIQEAYNQTSNTLLAMGASVDTIMQSLDARLASIDAAEQAELANATDEDAKQSIILKYKEERAQEKKFQAEKEKLNKQNLAKQHKEQLKKAAEISKQMYTSPKSLLFGLSEEQKAQAMADMKAANPSLTAKEIETQMAQGQLDAAMGALSDLAEQMMATGKKIAGNQKLIDTRLQGSTLNKQKSGSYWKELDSMIGKGVGMSPYIAQEDVVANLKTLVGKGISANVAQRAFLQTISEKIADTFEAADNTLLKLIRIQQADTTAARLGMESALTSFLNSMYETSEYMTEAASSIRANIYEASALMEASKATAFEYQVQKWMGSLHSVGFSNAEGLSSAFGKLAAGDISGITDGGYGNLLVMAAQQAGLSVSDILEEGLDNSKTNRLFESMVSYLAQIYEETHGSNVLSQQFASVYGLTASDLKAAANLSSSMSAVSSSNLAMSDMLGQLTGMANTMGKRTSMGEMMDNIFGNLGYTMSAGLYNNPALYATYQVADMLEDFAGGIDIPFVNVYGFGLDLNASVADLMKVAAMSGSVLGGLGKILGSLSNGGGFSGSGMLNAFGVDTSNGVTIIPRGKGASVLAGGAGLTTSESGFIGNESGDDVKNKTLSDASADGEKQIAEAKEEQEDKEAARAMMISGHIVDIYELLQDVVAGTKKLHVLVDTGDTPDSWTSGSVGGSTTSYWR